jgi:hypothetical protein
MKVTKETIECAQWFMSRSFSVVEMRRCEAALREGRFGFVLRSVRTISRGRGGRREADDAVYWSPSRADNGVAFGFQADDQ